MKTTFLLLSVLIFLVPIAAAVHFSDKSTHATALSDPISNACTGEQFRAFDYWLGKWTVKNAKGNVIGHSKISRVSDGCAILEEWSGAGGTTGRSINFFDKSIGEWRQTWVGGGGLILDLKGELVDGNMTLSQTKETPRGPVTHRITWTLMDDGRVEQRWDTSTDGGETWKQSFVGFYESKK